MRAELYQQRQALEAELAAAAAPEGPSNGALGADEAAESTSAEAGEESRAALKIQASFRGKQARGLKLAWGTGCVFWCTSVQALHRPPRPPSEDVTLLTCCCALPGAQAGGGHAGRRHAGEGGNVGRRGARNDRLERAGAAQAHAAAGERARPPGAEEGRGERGKPT